MSKIRINFLYREEDLFPKNLARFIYNKHIYLGGPFCYSIEISKDEMNQIPIEAIRYIEVASAKPEVVDFVLANNPVDHQLLDLLRRQEANIRARAEKKFLLRVTTMHDLHLSFGLRFGFRNFAFRFAVVTEILTRKPRPESFVQIAECCPERMHEVFEKMTTLQKSSIEFVVRHCNELGIDTSPVQV